MEVKNIFYTVNILIFCTILTSCSTVETIPYKEAPEIDLTEEKPIKEIKKIKKFKTEKIKIATILPLSGKNAKIGKSMLNSINLSLFDNDRNNNIELVIFDNKSSSYNSKKSIKKIAQEGINIVIGPIFTQSVEAISSFASENNIIILSFSNNSDLIGIDGIFLAGFSPEQEIDRITSYLIENEKNNFSVISPNNQYGIRIAKTLREILKIKDANFISSKFYIRNKNDFSKISQEILNSYIVSEDFKNYEEELLEIEDEEERKIRELEILAEHKIYTDVVLIAESSQEKAAKIAEEIFVNNIDGRVIQIIGTNHWHKSAFLEKETLDESLFAGPSDRYYSIFKEKYNQIYQQNPIRINSIAYDVTAFIADLLDRNKNNPTPITATEIVDYNDKKGYRGIDGLFRFLPNGIVERNLAILQIKQNEFEVVETPLRRFLNY